MATSRKPQPEKLDRLNEMPGYLLRRANQLVVAHFNDCSSDHGITPVQFATMSAVASAGEIDVTRLSAVVGFDKATLGSVVDRLEARGLVRRKPHPDDRRIKLVELTDQGQTLLDASWPSVEESQKRFLSTLAPSEQDMLMTLLRKVNGLAEPQQDATQETRDKADT